MKIKNVSLSFFILASLIISSFAFYVGAEISSTKTGNIFLDSDGDGVSNEEEKSYGTDPNNPDTDSDSYSDGAEIRSGYSPLIKAPGDKLPVADLTTAADTTVLGEETQENLTTEMAQKMSELTLKSTAENGQISLDDIQELVAQTMTSSTISEEELPLITRADIKIQEQNYSSLSTEKAAAKRKEDFLDYITAVSYIFSSNSAEPVTSLGDISSMVSGITKTITTAITTQSASGLSDLATSQKKIAEQLKAVEVPEDLVDIHIKALRFTLYAGQMTNLVQSNNADPLGSIANLSKIQGFMTVFSEFITEAQDKISEYGLTYDETVKEKLESLGIEVPTELNESELEALLKINTTDTTTP